MATTFTLRQCAAFLSLPTATVLARAIVGELPGEKIGKTWGFQGEEMEAYRHRQVNKQAAEIQANSDRINTRAPISPNDSAPYRKLETTTLKILDVDECADLVKTSRATVLKMVNGRELPAVPIGESWVFIEDHLIAHLLRRSEKHYAERPPPVETIDNNTGRVTDGDKTTTKKQSASGHILASSLNELQAQVKSLISTVASRDSNRPQRILEFRRPRDACKAIGISRTHYYHQISEGLQVPFVKIGKRAVAVPVHEQDAVNAARVAGYTDDEIRELVAALVAARKRPRLVRSNEFPAPVAVNRTVPSADEETPPDPEAA